MIVWLGLALLVGAGAPHLCAPEATGSDGLRVGADHDHDGHRTHAELEASTCGACRSSEDGDGVGRSVERGPLVTLATARPGPYRTGSPFDRDARLHPPRAPPLDALDV